MKRSLMKRGRRTSNPIRLSAREKQCQIRIPGHCLSGNETVVLCHYRMAGDGGGTKPNDRRAAYGCQACHDIVDGRRTQCLYTYDEIRLMHAEGVFRTQEILDREGLL